MDLLIITGTSGSGKSTVLKSLEDFGYHCIDNFPPSLYQTLPALINNSEEQEGKLAITIDIRSSKMFNYIESMFEFLTKQDINYTMLFIDADDNTLQKRFKETRRNHPLMFDTEMTINEAITKERELLQFIRAESAYYIDTTDLRTAELKETILSILGDSRYGQLNVQFVSFGFKYGPLRDADLIFDLRCLKNPYYDITLRFLTGEDEKVRNYVFESKEAVGMYEQIENFLNFSLPLYKAEGRSQLVVGFGCTGGKHRSVSFAHKFYEDFKFEGIQTFKRHRDIEIDRADVK